MHANQKNKIIEKIHDFGFAGFIKAVFERGIRILNNTMVYMLRIFPINTFLVVLESEGDLSDNAYALYNYMNLNGYLKKYRIVWLVDDLESARKNKWENTSFELKNPVKICFNRNFALATCKWYIYDHRCVVSKLRKRNGQSIVYLCHGTALKAAKGADLKTPTIDDILFVTGEIPYNVLPLYRNTSNLKVIQAGFSRLDYFYSDLHKEREIIEETYHFSNYSKVILWMPTFRESNVKKISENYQNQDIHLPLINSFERFQQFNKYLCEKNMLVILKIHHLQKELDIFHKKYSNIIFISDGDIKDIGVQLYQFITFTDALVTDYSSISVDYMLLDRPMIFILDDYEDYKKSRGIITENVLDFMVGDHVYSFDELLNSLDKIKKGYDDHVIERRNMIPKFHKYQDGMSSKRILEYLGITKID